MSHKKFLIAGSTGSIGKALIKTLTKIGFPCYGVNREILNSSQPFDFNLDEDTILVITAGWAPPRPLDKLLLYEGNVLFIAKLANILSKQKISAVIFLSTISVYADIHNRDERTGRLAVESDYALTKYCGESIVRHFFKNTCVVSLRLPGVIGEEINNSLTVRLLEKIRRGENLELNSRTTPFNSVVSIDDIVSFMVTVNFKKLGNLEGIVNFAASEPLQFGTYVAELAKTLGTTCSVVWLEGQFGAEVPIDGLRKIFNFIPSPVTSNFQRIYSYYLGKTQDEL